MNTPLVSIVVPILELVKNNRVNHFHGLMDSIKNQSYDRRRIELILVDGGSKDGTLELVEKYQKEGLVHLWISEKDSGIYSAINKGINLSSGDIINVASSDDYFTPDALRDSVKALIKEGADYVHGLTPNLLASGEVWYVAGESYAWNQIYFGMPICHQSLFVERSVFEKVGFYSEDFQVISDYLFVKQLHLQKLNRVSLNQITCYFRYYDGKCSRGDIMFQEFERHYRDTLEFLNLEYEEFLFFLQYSNTYISSRLVNKKIGSSKLLRTLANLADSHYRSLVMDFQRCVLFCVYQGNAFQPNTKSLFSNDGLLHDLLSQGYIHREDAAILAAFPCISKSKEMMVRVDNLLNKIQGLAIEADQELRVMEHLFELQQLMLKRMFSCLRAL